MHGCRFPTNPWLEGPVAGGDEERLAEVEDGVGVEDRVELADARPAGETRSRRRLPSEQSEAAKEFSEFGCSAEPADEALEPTRADAAEEPDDEVGVVGPSAKPVAQGVAGAVDVAGIDEGGDVGGGVEAFGGDLAAEAGFDGSDELVEGGEVGGRDGRVDEGAVEEHVERLEPERAGCGGDIGQRSGSRAGVGPQLVPEGVEMAASCRAVACRNSCQMAFSSGSSEPSADEPRGLAAGRAGGRARRRSRGRTGAWRSPPCGGGWRRGRTAP